jgi:PTS system nitrogen regulatory IIA component
MKLGEFLKKEYVFPALESENKDKVLAELVKGIGEDLPELDTEAALNVLVEREALGTTGIGDGVAIPHGKMDSLDEIILAVGRSTKGVDFESLDFKPCTIFFLVLAPEQVAGMHLRILAHISRLLKDEEFRKSFMGANGREELWKLLRSA